MAGQQTSETAGNSQSALSGLLGLRFRRDADGTPWLIFEPKSGLSAMLNMIALADARGPITGRAIKDWVEEQP